ncbi:MAG: putative glycosyl hydrolase [Solirubrobacterales bacterium]|nr:putative glycosyl hydrolase [Solirubrobacterales bacterium]
MSRTCAAQHRAPPGARGPNRTRLPVSVAAVPTGETWAPIGFDVAFRSRAMAATPRKLSAPTLLAALILACAICLPGAARAAAAPGATPAPGAGEAPAPAPPPAPSAVPVELRINPLAPGHPVPARFLGLSFEAQAIDQLGALGAHGDLVRLLRSLGPGLLRLGGITADQNIGWSDSVTARPAWATSVIGPAQMRAIGALARRSGWQVLLTVGMAHYEPQSAAREVAAARAALGRNLFAVEIGNEPDAFGRHGFRALPWGAQQFEEQVTSYRDAITALTPGVAIVGPDVSGSGAFPEWGFAEALTQAPVLLTGHHYPLGCTHVPAPSIELLLSPPIRGLEARSLETYLSISRARNIPFRMDETNSVSCGGVPGVSNTYASALWAAAYIGQNMAAGTVGVNLQGNPTNCAGYTPLCAPDPAALAAGQMRAQPDWYALLLTRSLIGYRPLPTTITAAVAPNLVAYGFDGPAHTRKLLLVDEEAPGSLPLALRVPVGAGLGAARVLRLTGPSLGATDGVRLAGHAVAANGKWLAPLRAEHATVRNGLMTLSLKPASAALVTIVPAKKKAHRRGARRGH